MVTPKVKKNTKILNKLLQLFFKIGGSRRLLKLYINLLIYSWNNCSIFKILHVRKCCSTIVILFMVFHLPFMFSFIFYCYKRICWVFERISNFSSTLRLLSKRLLLINLFKSDWAWSLNSGVYVYFWEVSLVYSFKFGFNLASFYWD